MPPGPCPGQAPNQGLWPSLPPPPLSLHCPAGHVMEARVVWEIMLGLDPLGYTDRCARCYCDITTDDARYTCTVCSYDCCMSCVAELLPLPTSVAGQVWAPAPPGSQGRRRHCAPHHIMAGDIFLCGPSAWGIHHVVLVRGPMKLECCDFANLLGIAPGKELLSCYTAESSQGSQGQSTPWIMARSFYTRDVVTGEVVKVGDIEHGAEQIEKEKECLPVKVLLHPLRPGHGGPTFNPFTFEEAVRRGAGASQAWGLSTALRAMSSGQERLDPLDYPDPASRAALLQALRECWASRPICSSVAILVWQSYFEIASSLAGPHAEDMAATQILRWVPLLSDQTTPSGLLKVLTTCGWVLRGNFDQ